MSKETTYIAFECTQETFKPVAHDMVGWLDPDRDLHLVQAIFENPPSREEWDDWHKQGYQYCAIVTDGSIVSIAAVWKYSESAWETAAVWTKEEFRCQGYAKAVCSFVTSYILNCGRKATCSTRKTNVPMIRVAENLGFHRT